jgi:transcription elongation factor Elf1
MTTQSIAPAVLNQRTSCPACGSNAKSCIYREPYSSPGVKQYLDRHYGGRASSSVDTYEYELVECTQCGLVYQSYIPSADFLSELYDIWIPKTELDRTRSNYELDFSVTSRKRYSLLSSTFS